MTTTGSDNVRMKAVNRSIGYTDARGLGYFEVPVAGLTACTAG